MKPLFRVVILMLIALGAKGQYTTVTNLSGTVLYGTTNVTVTSAGTASSTPWCGVNPYWIGAGTGSVVPSPGSYTFTFSPPVSGVRVYTTAMDVGIGIIDTEKISLTINGTFYPLTTANLTTYTGTCGQPAAAIVGGWLAAVIDFGMGAGGQLDVTSGTISTCTVTTNGFDNGSTFTFQFITGPTNNGPLCSGDTLKLFWNGDSTGATFFWYGPGGFTSTLQNPVRPATTYADSGLYYVVKTVGGIPDTLSTRVIIKPNPLLVVSSNSPICQGVSNILTLFATPDSLGETYSWWGPGTFTSTLQNPTVTGFTAADTGWYVVTATWNGCSSTDSTHVILAPVPPPPVISGPTFYCSGQPFVPFTTTGTGTILWYDVSTGGTGSPTAPVINTSVPGTYKVWATQTILGCESNRDSITVIVRTTPAAPAVTGTTTYCQYFPYIAPTATGISILWYTVATGGTGTTTVPWINTDIPGTYTIYASQSDSGCESPRAPFTVTVHPEPAPPVITNTPGNYCPGQPFNPFTVVSGTGVLWYDVATGGTGTPSAPVISTLVPGAFPVWATQTVLGCESDRTTFTVTVYDSVSAHFNYEIKYGCKADTVVFTNTSYGATNFVWEFGDRASSIEKHPVHVYTWQAIDTVILMSRTGGCIAYDTQIINLVHPLQALFTTDTNLICQGNSITFTDASVGTGLSYMWHFGDGTTSNSSTTPTHIYPHTGIYKAYEVVTDFIPCRDTLYKTITVDTISPIRMLITDTVLCRGTYITFTGLYSAIGNTGVTWTLGNGEEIKNENPLVYAYPYPGTFTIKGEAHYRVCPDTSVTRKVTVLPPPSIDLGPDATICKGGVALQLTDLVNGQNPNASWIWNTGAKTPGIAVTEPGVYTATVKVDGCYATGSVTVSNDCYMNIPNVFSPNGDGLNDYFYPRQYLSKGLISFSMQIYNRWGQLIFETNAVEGAGWDGKLNDVDQPTGVYIYVVDGIFKDGQKEHHQGNVTLIR